MRFSMWMLCFCLCAGAMLSPSARAQSAGSGTSGADVPTLAALSRELVCPCPDCGGKALDLCEATCKLGQERRDTVAAQLKLGQDREQVLQFMSATYGPQILGEPPREGWGVLSLAMPLACLALGAFPLLWFTRGRKSVQPKRGTKRRADVAAGEDERVAAALKDFDF